MSAGFDLQLKCRLSNAIIAFKCLEMQIFTVNLYLFWLYTGNIYFELHILQQKIIKEQNWVYDWKVCFLVAWSLCFIFYPKVLLGSTIFFLSGISTYGFFLKNYFEVFVFINKKKNLLINFHTSSKSLKFLLSPDGGCGIYTFHTKRQLVFLSYNLQNPKLYTNYEYLLGLAFPIPYFVFNINFHSYTK